MINDESMHFPSRRCVTLVERYGEICQSIVKYRKTNRPNVFKFHLINYMNRGYNSVYTKSWAVIQYPEVDVEGSVTGLSSVVDYLTNFRV